MFGNSKPTGRGKIYKGAQGAEVNLVGGGTEADAIKKIYAGLSSTWGIDPQRDGYMRDGYMSDRKKAYTILALAGKIWSGANFESFVLTFEITNVSRGFTHQMVRHRFMGFGQEGTRDTDQSNFDFIMPETIHKDEELIQEVASLLKKQSRLYHAMLKKGIPYQDASYILPKGLATDIVVHTTFRALQESAKARMSNSMHWEINHVYRLMQQAMIQYYPTFALWLVPACERSGHCESRGTLFPPCGKLPLRKEQSAIKNHFGADYMHFCDSNGNADIHRVGEQYDNWLEAEGERDELIDWAEKTIAQQEQEGQSEV